MPPSATLDRDTRAVVDVLRAAITGSGLTQHAFAKATGTSPSRLSAYLHGTTAPSAVYLMKAQRIGAGLARAREENVPTSIDAAASLRNALETARRPSAALRFALEARDRLRDTLVHRPHLLDAWDAKAPSLGQREWDTLFAALVEHEFAITGRPAPPWAAAPPLEHEWIPAQGRRSEDEVRRSTPDWLRAKGILVAEADLVTA